MAAAHQHRHREGPAHGSSVSGKARPTKFRPSRTVSLFTGARSTAVFRSSHARLPAPISRDPASSASVTATKRIVEAGFRMADRFACEALCHLCPQVFRRGPRHELQLARGPGRCLCGIYCKPARRGLDRSFPMFMRTAAIPAATWTGRPSAAPGRCRSRQDRHHRRLQDRPADPLTYRLRQAQSMSSTRTASRSSRSPSSSILRLRWED